MPLYPPKIPCCHQIKANGVQCGSPAMAREDYCYFHLRWRRQGANYIARIKRKKAVNLPDLENAHSIQASITEIMRRLSTNELSPKTAGLMLYALQTAVINMNPRTSNASPPLQSS